MKCYLAHASDTDFKAQLYAPIKAHTPLWTRHKFIFPHANGPTPTLSKTIIEQCDCVIAEVSWPSTGTGIELGWAHAAGCPILCIHQTHSAPSTSLRLITPYFMEYQNPQGMVQQLESVLPGILA